MTDLRRSWKRFIETYASQRAPLYRYCRSLTRSPWDAEDLVQDALSRAFVMLAQMGEEPPNPQAWLFRVASNAWIDVLRRARTAESYLEVEQATAPDPRAVREAAGTLMGQLSPQERAAVVLKDVFDYSLEETAEVLMTTPGAIKAALHRGRERLREPSEERTDAAPAVLETFCRVFASRDLDALAALLTETAVVEVVGATSLVGRDAAKRTVLWGMMFGASRFTEEGVLPVPPRLEIVRYRGGWVVLSWYSHADGEAVRAVNRVEASEDGASVTRLQNYFYNPEFIEDVCEELGVPCKVNGYTYG